MINKKYFLILIIFILISSKALSSDIKIIYQIEDEIITTHDIKEEIKYLKIIQDLSNLNNKELYQVSLNSLIKEKIKKKR